MQVLVSGAGGLVGSALVRALEERGDAVVRLVRPASAGALPGAPSAVRWEPAAGRLDPGSLPALDAVVHLAGENIAAGRWTAAQKRRIEDSRVRGTRLLAATLAALERPPRVLVSASAVGYYGDRGDELLDDASPPGSGFLAGVCAAWETAAEAARQAGIRVVQARIGVVLSRDGGVLPRLLRPFRLGLGGVVGSGRQFLSWITRHDLVRALLHLVAHEELAGPVNAVAPRPVTNRELTETLGRLLRRPTLLPLPGAVARLALGEMADELLLASQRVVPSRLLDSGFRFDEPELGGALERLLGT